LVTPGLAAVKTDPTFAISPGAGAGMLTEVVGGLDVISELGCENEGDDVGKEDSTIVTFVGEVVGETTVVSVGVDVATR
jgi:hypothetical protein